MSENKATVEQLDARLAVSPFNAWMGLKVTRLDEDSLEIGLEWRDDMIANPTARSIHGGILAALIDAAADFAIAAKLGAPVPTIDLRVDYHRAAGPGDLRAVGRVIRLGGTNAVAEAAVYDGQDRLIASGRGVYFAAAAKS